MARAKAEGDLPLVGYKDVRVFLRIVLRVLGA